MSSEPEDAVVVVEFELLQLKEAIEAARDLLASGGCGGHGAPLSILGLVDARMELLRSVLRRETDPKVLGRRALAPAADSEDAPFEIAMWSEEQQRAHHLAEVERLDCRNP
jgi:hypothetical protein